MKTYEWKTSGGVEVELIVNSEMYPQTIAINGKEFKVAGFDSYKNCVTFNMKNKLTGILLPTEIIQKMDDEIKPRLEKAKKEYLEEKAADAALRAAINQ